MGLLHLRLLYFLRLKAAVWAVDRSVGAHVSEGVECRPGWTQGFSWAELRRGMRDAQGNGACDGNETEMGGLHPRGEPDTFLCSHSCL